MKKILHWILGAIFIALFTACRTPENESLPTDTPLKATDVPAATPTEPVLSNEAWVIMTIEYAEEKGLASWLVEGDGFWIPSADDIFKLEEKLAGTMKENSHLFFRQPPAWERLDEYQRQYVGFEREEKKFIYGNYFCNNIGIDWYQALVIVEDGGDCYFQVEYDVAGGNFIMLMVNGES